MGDHHDAVAGHDPQHREEPHERADRDHTAGDVVPDDPAHEGNRQRHERENGEADPLEDRQQDEEDAADREDRVPGETPLSSLTLGEDTDDPRVVLERELDLLEAILHLPRH